MLLDDFLSNFVQTTDYPTLDAMKYLMKNLGNPEKKLKFVHVAGTNGKGSICECLNQILIDSHYQVGKFISPHLFVSNESISINNKNILDSEFEKYRKLLETLSNNYFHETKRKVTRFEVLTSLAILYFADNNCDIVVLEVGLGGMYDCTNIVNSLISVFGSIALDHTAILGNTIEEVAKQKAGIIKENSNTVIFEQQALPIIEKACEEKKSNLHIVSNTDLSNYRFDKNYQYFDFKHYKNLKINLKGKKQLENAGVVITCVEILNKNGFYIPVEAIYSGISNVVHPARFEILKEKPLIIFDGAHNENAMNHFVKTVQTLYPTKTKTFMVSIITTKDYQADLKLLLNHFENCNFIFTNGTMKDKFFDSKILYDFAKSLKTSNHLEILEFENGMKNLNSEVNFIVGSFYVYDKTKEILENNFLKH